MAKAFSIWKEKPALQSRPSNEPTLELHSSLTHALNFNGEWKGGAWTRAVQTNETLNYWIIFTPLTHENRNLSSTVSVLLFQVIYSWNNHQQNEENLLHFPFFFGVCQGLSHLELKGKTLLRIGQAQFGSAAFSAMLCFFGKRWIAGLMAVKISLYVLKRKKVNNDDGNKNRSWLHDKLILTNVSLYYYRFSIDFYRGWILNMKCICVEIHHYFVFYHEVWQ